jgi:hypothetical protein
MTNENSAWVQNPFVITAKPAGFNVHECERLIDLVSDCLKQNFKDLP